MAPSSRGIGGPTTNERIWFSTVSFLPGRKLHRSRWAVSPSVRSALAGCSCASEKSGASTIADSTALTSQASLQIPASDGSGTDRAMPAERTQAPAPASLQCVPGMVERPTRCEWAGTEPRMVAYHDDEWGVPTHDDAGLFELLTLEGAQAGLSWRTILDKRGGYRTAFAGFDPARVAAYTDDDVERLLHDPSIVRHRGKIGSTVNNARRILEVQAERG